MKAESNGIVSIIVVTSGANNYLKPCLDSLSAQTRQNLEIIVIDNSLDHRLSREIGKNYPLVKLYSSPINLFYCGALNKGIELSRGGIILCLNDDVILDKGFIAEAIRGFSLDKKIGMVSGKILRGDSLTIDSSGLFLTVYRTARERGYGLKDSGQFEKEGLVFGVNGAVAFYSREMLNEIKEGDDYFDSDFRFFYEDLDVAWRANRRGFKARYVPSAIAYHARGGSLRKAGGIGKKIARSYLNDELYLDLVKNRYLTIIKNESIPGFLLHFPFLIAYDLVSWGYCLLFRPQLIKKFLKSAKYFKAALNKRRFSVGKSGPDKLGKIKNFLDNSNIL